MTENHAHEPTPSAAAAGERWADKRVFTTGEAAEVCRVSQQTIIRCFDSGRLAGFRVPGSRFRRIPRDELVRFMRANDIPTAALEGTGKRVLIVDDDPAILEMFRDAISRRPGLEVRTASSGYEAGMLTESFRPHVIVLDYMLPDVNGNVVCQKIRAREDMASTRIVFISGVVDPQEIAMLKKSGADEFVSKPFNIERLLARVEQLAQV
jgi:excisionase family DNA binding protein